MNEKFFNNILFKKNARALFWISICVAIFFGGYSIANLFLKSWVYPTNELFNAFYPSDYVNLFFGVPILIVSMIVAFKPCRIGLSGWFASLLFILYSTIACLFAVRGIYSLVVNAVIIIFTLTTLALLLASIDYSGFVPSQFPFKNVKVVSLILGIILSLISLFFLGKALYIIIGNVAGSFDLSLAVIGTSIADIIISLIWLLSGIFFFTRPKTGFISGFISYLSGTLLFIAYLIYLIVQAAVSRIPLIVNDFIIASAISLVMIVPTIILLVKLYKNNVVAKRAEAQKQTTNE